MNLYKIKTYYYWKYEGQSYADKVSREHYVVAPSIMDAISCIPLDDRVQSIDILVEAGKEGSLLSYPQDVQQRPWMDENQADMIAPEGGKQ